MLEKAAFSTENERGTSASGKRKTRKFGSTLLRTAKMVDKMFSKICSKILEN